MHAYEPIAYVFSYVIFFSDLKSNLGPGLLPSAIHIYIVYICLFIRRMLAFNMLQMLNSRTSRSVIV